MEESIRGGAGLGVGLLNTAWEIGSSIFVCVVGFIFLCLIYRIVASLFGGGKLR